MQSRISIHLWVSHTALLLDNWPVFGTQLYIFGHTSLSLSNYLLCNGRFDGPTNSGSWVGLGINGRFPVFNLWNRLFVDGFLFRGGNWPTLKPIILTWSKYLLESTFLFLDPKSLSWVEIQYIILSMRLVEHLLLIACVLSIGWYEILEPVVRLVRAYVCLLPCFAPYNKGHPKMWPGYL